MHYAIVDVETTGGSPKSSKITEIAIYKFDGLNIIDELVTLINPEINIPEFIVRLTGISDRMVENSPKFYEIAKQIIEFTEDCIFVAHNVGFDYGMVRQEFKWLGFDFRKPHLCTVRASREILPGLNSYSLGKLSRELGISIKDRHRAGGDALATTKLFQILHQRDQIQLSTFIQEDINPKILHPSLNIEVLENLPDKTGIYKFYNEEHKLIYIGKSRKIKNRIDQHLRNTSTKKGMQMLSEISSIEYELTGSELIALLKESQLIKQHKPIYNRRLVKSKFPFGIYDIIKNNYITLEIHRTANQDATPILSFSTRPEAIKYLTQICETSTLCQKLCDLYPSSGSCFHYTIKKCYGACVSEETPESYNHRAQKLIDELSFHGHSFFIIDKGRNKSEKSIVMIDRGMIVGFGYAPYHFQNQPIYRWSRFIDQIKEDRDAKSIINQYLKKNRDIRIVRF